MKYITPGGKTGYNIEFTTRIVTPYDGQSAAYHAGKLPPNYSVPAIYDPEPTNKHFYWDLPSFPTDRLIAGWFLWQASLPKELRHPTYPY